MGSVALALALTIVFCAAARADAPPDPITTVKLTYEAPRAVVVDLAMPLDWFRRDLPFVELELVPQQFKREGGLAQFIKLLDQSGKERSFAARVDKPGATLTVRYRVTLDHVAAEPANGPDDVPHATKSGWWLTGRALLPMIRTPEGKRLDTTTTIELVGFPGKLVSTLGDGAKLNAPSLAAARDAVYYTGDFLDERVLASAPSVRLLSASFTSAELAPLASLVKRTVALATARFGQPTQPQVLLIVDRNPWTFVEGGVIGSAITLLLRDPPSDKAAALSGTVVVHELIHLWHRADQMWLSEGVTRYYEIMFRALLDNLDREAIINELETLWDRYAAEANNRVARDDSSAWVYHAGALIALCADANLRLWIKATSHLDHFERIAELRDESGQIISERFIGALAERSNAAVSELLQQRDQKGPFDVQACFNTIQYPVELTTFSGFTRRAMAVKILQVGGYSTQSNKILKVLPGSRFAEGDELLRCNGGKLISIAALDWIVKETPAGQTFSCTVLRDGREHDVVVTMPALDAGDRTWRQRLIFSRQKPKPDKYGVSWPPR